MPELSLTLYSTWGCHLCDEAVALLQQQNVQFQQLDIVDDPVAFARFRSSIPVLGSAESFLYWPFDQAAVAAFVQELSSQGK